MKFLTKTTLLLSVMLLSLSAFSQNLNYGSLPDEYKQEVNRLEWRKLIKESKEGDFGLSPIDRIYYGEKPVDRSRSYFGAMSVTSWGLDYLRPNSIMQRVIDECGEYPFIAVTVDSGTDEDHVELRGNQWLPSSNYTGQEGKHWHGTHVSGIIRQMIWEVIQKHENGLMKDVQILNVNGSGSFSSAVNMVAAETSFFSSYIEDGYGVFLNNSWGYNGPPIEALESELEKSSEAGLTWIGSAGNAGQVIEGYPGMSDYFSSVASIDTDGERSSFSTMNEWVDVAAPGRNINSTLPDDQQGLASGTSMASPFITGLACLAYGKYGPVLQGYNMNTFLHAICTDVSPNGWDNQTGWGVPFVINMLNTDPCSVPGIDCEDDPVDDPDDPGEDDPVDPEEPEISSSVTFNTGGHVMRYRTESQQGWEILYISDMQVSADGSIPVDELQEMVQDFIDNYFNYRGIVLTDIMKYTDATWWTAQFLEYVGRNEGVPIQVSYIVAHDEYGHSSRQTGFDKAATNATDVYIENVDLKLPDSFTEEPAPLPRWFIKAEWYVENEVGGGATPKSKFEDSVGLYYTSVSYFKEPTEAVINKNPPFPGAEVKNIIAIYKR